MKVAILAGGLATRLGPVTQTTPKSLVDVRGRPFAAHQVELLVAHGFDEVVFLVGHLGELIRDALGDGRRWQARLQYVFDGPRPLGTGGSIRQALDTLGDRFLVLYGDSYLECDYRAVERAFAESGRQALMTVCRNDDQWDRSNVLFEAGRIVRYAKVTDAKGTYAETSPGLVSPSKPGAGCAGPTMRHIDYGLGAFRREAFDGWPAGEPFDLATVYQRLLADGQLAGYEVAGRFYEIGSPAGLEETRAHLAELTSPRVPFDSLRSPGAGETSTD